MADVTLQSFVVKLRYLVDESTSKNFHANVKQSIEGLNGIRLAALGALVGIEEMVRRSTGYFSNLDYMSRSVGASADEIEKFRAQLTGAGESAQQADSVLTTLGEKWRHAGFRNAMEGVVGGPVKSTVDFMDQVSKKYHDLYEQFGHDERAGPLMALRTQVENLFGDSVSRAMQDRARNWDLSNKMAADTAQIYKDLHVNAEEAGKQATETEHAFTLVGKSLQVAFIEVLTTKGPDGKTILQVLTEAARAFSQWLIDKDTQKNFRETVDFLLKGLPAVEWALCHIQEIVIGLGLIWVANFGVKMVGAISTLLGPLGTLFDSLSKVKTAAAEAQAATAAAEEGGLLAAIAGVGYGSIAAVLGGITATGVAAWAAWSQGHGAPGTMTDPKNPLRFGDPTMPFGSGTEAPGYQHGGIVPANLHPGEMVLPNNISYGLQSFFSGGANSFTDTSRRMLQGFLSWFAGDTSYKPQVELSDDTIRELKGAGGGGGGGEGGPGPGHPGAGYGYSGSKGYGTRFGGGAGGPIGHYTGQKGERAEEWRAAGPRDAAELEKFIREEAARQGVDPNQALWVSHNEGFGNPVANVPSEQSYSAFQLNMARGAVGDQMLRETGIDPSKPENERAAIAYGLHWARTHGWGAWTGAHGASLRATGPGYRPDYKTLASQGGFGRKAATPTAAPAPTGGGSPAQAVEGALKIIGDSIGVGLAGELGYPVWNDPKTGFYQWAGGPNADAWSGAAPKDIYERAMKHITDFANKNVVVASGSNDPRQTGYIDKLLAALKEQHAKVTLLGVGHGVRGADALNKQLGELAQKYGDAFTGALEGTVGRVHPSSYRLTRGQVQRAQQQHVTVNTTYNVNETHSADATAKRIKHMHNRDMAHLINHNRPMVA